MIVEKINTIDTTENDRDGLQQFGYQQQLNRTMGGFSSFAISFSLISVLTGIFANFNVGFQQVGGTIVWSWLLVSAGQLLVALVMADLSVRFPISGYGYQWTARLMNPHYGFFTGWFLLIQFVTGVPAISQAMAITFTGMMGFETIGWGIPLLTIGIISSVAVIHIYGIKIVSLVNNIGVYAELMGVAILIIGLLVVWFISGIISTENLFNTGDAIAAKAGGFSSFALSLLLGAWCLTGFEAAADLAEETQSPRKHVPRAVITSLVTAALAGFLIIALLMLSAGNITAAQQSNNPLLYLLQKSIGTRATAFISIIVLMSIYACCVASMATGTRLLFSMSRDNMLPFSKYLCRVNEKRKVPQYATVVIWFFSCLVIIGFRKIEIITSVGTVAAYLGYAGIMLATIITKKNFSSADGFSLRAWRKPIQIVAMFWTLLVVAALCIPDTKIEGMEELHLPAKSALMAMLLGIVIYFVSVNKRIKKLNAGPPKI